VTITQRFASTLNLNIQFYALFLNVVHVVICDPSLVKLLTVSGRTLTCGDIHIFIIKRPIDVRS
jgi:hypothetical protein